MWLLRIHGIGQQNKAHKFLFTGHFYSYKNENLIVADFIYDLLLEMPWNISKNRKIDYVEGFVHLNIGVSIWM